MNVIVQRVLRATIATVALTQPAFAGNTIPLLAISGADATFHGTVTGIQQCTSAGGESVWSFVTFQVHDELVGDVVPAQGMPVNTYTVRMPYGTHPDGSRSAPAGMPQMNIGDSFILGVHAASDGIPDLFPTFLFGPGAFLRTFSDESGGFVTAPDGTFIQQSPNTGKPIVGRTRTSPADRNWPGTAPLVSADVRASASEYSATVGYDGTAAPQGAWKGRMRISSDATVTVADGGSQYFLADHDCIAELEGSYGPQGLSLEGSCNAPYVGKLQVMVNGTHSAANGWSGILRIEAAYDSDIAALFNWDDTPWSSPIDFLDNFSAHTTSAMPANSVPNQYLNSFTISEHPKRMVSFVAGWDGRRPLMSIDDMKQWIVDTASAKSHFGRQVYSQNVTIANCGNYPIALINP